MGRHETPAEAVIVDYVCDECGYGHMLPSGMMLLSNPPKFPHECNKCGATQTFNTKYPETVFRRAQAAQQTQGGGNGQI